MIRILLWFGLMLASASLALADAVPSARPTPFQAPVPGPQDFPAPPPGVERAVRAQISVLRSTATVPEKEAAIRTIVDAGSAAIPLLIEELERRQRSTLQHMIFALGATGNRRVIPILERELTRLQGRPYMEVLYALALAGEPSSLLRAMRSTYATLPFDRNASAVDFIAGAIGPDSVPLLLSEIPRRAEESRMAGLRALGTVCDDSATDFLLAWAERPSPVDKQFALIALARIGTPRGAEALLKGMDHEDPAVREAAIEGLGYLREARAVPRLVEKLESRQEMTPAERVNTIWTLALIADAASRDALLAHWNRTNEDASQRVLVIRAFGRLRDERTTGLLAAEASGTGQLAVDAAQSLLEIPGNEARDALLDVCNQAASLDAALYAALELVERGDPRAAPCVVSRLRQEIETQHRLSPRSEEILDLLPGVALRGAARSLRALAEEVPAPAIGQRLRTSAHKIELSIDLGSDVEPWLELLEQGTPGELELAIRRLGELGDPRAVQSLRDVFGQIDPAKAHLVPEALARIDSERAVPFLIALLRDVRYRVPSLTRARNAAARALVSLSDGEHVAAALRHAYLAERGRLFVPLLALAKLRGAAGIDELIEMKPLLLRQKGRKQVLRHERINWAIRMLRTGRPIPLEEVTDVR